MAIGDRTRAMRLAKLRPSENKSNKGDTMDVDHIVLFGIMSAIIGGWH